MPKSLRSFIVSSGNAILRRKRPLQVNDTNLTDQLQVESDPHPHGVNPSSPSLLTRCGPVSGAETSPCISHPTSNTVNLENMYASQGLGDNLVRGVTLFLMLDIHTRCDD